MLQAAQTITPKPYIMKSVTSVHSPTSHTNVTSVSFSKLNTNRPNTCFSVPDFAPVRSPPQPQQQQTHVAAQQSYNPYHNQAAAAAPAPHSHQRPYNGEFDRIFVTFLTCPIVEMYMFWLRVFK